MIVNGVGYSLILKISFNLVYLQEEPDFWLELPRSFSFTAARLSLTTIRWSQTNFEYDDAWKQQFCDRFLKPTSRFELPLNMSSLCGLGPVDFLSRFKCRLLLILTLFHWNQICLETCPFQICQFKFARSMHPDYCRHVTVSSSRRQLYDKVFSRYKVKITRGTRQWQDVAQAQKPTRWLALRGGELLLQLDCTFEWNID